MKQLTKIKQNNEKVIKEYLDDCKVGVFGKIMPVDRAKGLRYNLIRISNKLEKNFDDVTREDIKKYVTYLNEQQEQGRYSKHTVRNYKAKLKKFWKWLKKTEDSPEEVRWIKTGMSRIDRRLPEELLTQEEVKRLINYTPSIKYKLFVALLYESGFRIGEMFSIKLKSISFEKNEVVRIMVNGKTGMRRIPLYNCVPFLKKYLNEYHIAPDNPEARLFYSKEIAGRPNNHKSIRKTIENPLKKAPYITISKMLRGLGEKANIKKKVNPHSFRHARASYLANYLTEAQMKQYFGWVQGSEMASIYVHLSGRDLDNALLGKVHGLKEIAKEVQDELLKPKQCRCGKIVEATAKFCPSCERILDVQELIKLEEREKLKNQLLNRIVDLVDVNKLDNESLEIINKLR